MGVMDTILEQEMDREDQVGILTDDYGELVDSIATDGDIAKAEISIENDEPEEGSDS